MGLFSRTLSRLDELKRALTRDPASRQFLALADEYRRQGQSREAIDVLRQGLAQDPTAVAGHVALGRLLQQAGQLDEALSCFQIALKLDPQNLVAIRQAADAHLARGEKVEAIKRLKLFRGLNPGDREVNEIIRQLEGELAAPAGAPPPLRTEPVLSVAAPREAPEPPPLPVVDAPPRPPRLPEVPPFPAAGPGEVVPDQAAGPGAIPPTAPGPRETVAEIPEDSPRAGALPGPELEGPFPEAPPESEPEAFPEQPSPDLPAISFAGGPAEGPFGPGPVSPAPSSGGAEPEVRSGAEPGAAAPPAVTETLAELLLAQGHLVDARDAYRELARDETDPARAQRFRDLAEAISARGAQSVRGRLEAWVEPFARSRGPRETDLLAAVEEAVFRLGPSAAVVTDFEGVPVVSAGLRGEAEAMENLAAELTAFWKHVRRSRAEVGEGALDSLVLSGTAGTAAVKVITPAYALLLKAGSGIPAGRIRFEAARAAEQLRPALL